MILDALWVLFAAFLFQADLSAQEPLDEFTTWVRSRAIPLKSVEAGRGSEDLAPLASMVGNARVVAFGESAHLVHEPLALRNRLFAYMVEELGFTAMAAETGYSEGRLVDAYVRGLATVDDVDKVVAQAFSWFPTPLQENRQLIDWMREHNALPSTTRPLRFYGIDLTGGRMAVIREPQPAITDALDYVERLDASQGGELREQLEPLLDSFSAAEYQQLDPAGRDRITAGVAGLVAVLERNRVRFIDADGEAGYEVAHRSAVVARQIDAYLRVHPGPDALRDGGDFTAAQNTRDAAMAANLLWTLKREGPDGRIFTFAHNMHLRKGRPRTEAFPEYSSPDIPGAAMGEVLRTTIGDQMLVIGSTFGRSETLGPPQDGSVEALLGNLGLPLFVLDLRSVSAPAGLTTPRSMRVENRYGEVCLPRLYDALVYIHRATPARPLGER